MLAMADTVSRPSRPQALCITTSLQTHILLCLDVFLVRPLLGAMMELPIEFNHSIFCIAFDIFFWQ